MDSYHRLFFPQFPIQSREAEGNTKCSSVDVVKNYGEPKQGSVVRDVDKLRIEKTSEQNS